MFENPPFISLQGEREFTRRKLLTGAGVNILVLGASFGSVEAGDLALSSFLRLSTKLTGHPNLSVETGRLYLLSILSNGGSHKHLKKSRSLEREERASFESRIIADWYSGQTVVAKGTICIDYTGALLWDAIGFARPRGVPDAEAGHWTLAPF